MTMRPAKSESPPTSVEASWRDTATAEEIRDREKALEQILKLRAEGPPLEMSAGELIRLARREEAKWDG